MFIFVHIGQCGIQIGSELWSNILNSSNKYSVPGLTDSASRLLPCILSDTEPKVVQTFNKSVRKAAIHPLNVITKKKGCGNNWSCGYNDSLSDSILDSIRRTAEQSCADCLMGVVIFHSTAGGTGSGVTSRVMEELRNHYPNQYIINVSITPFISGESPLQYYNTLLTLSWLQDYSDGVIVIHNDDHNNNVTNMANMNKTVAALLTNCLKPLKQRTLYNLPCEIVQTLCPTSDCKFINPSTIFNNWTDIRLTGRRPGVSQNILCILRGDKRSITHLMSNIKPLEKKLTALYSPVKWNPFPIDYWFSGSCLPVTEERCTSVLTNNYNITEYLDIVVKKAAIMFNEKAYVHWYKKHGTEEETFIESFRSVQQIIENYKSSCL